LYSASSCIHTSNALFVTNHSRRLHSRRVQPANTGWRTGWPGSPVSCTKVPTFRNHIMGYYSFNRPRRDGKLICSYWLTDSGCRTHTVVKQPSISLAQDKESPPVRNDVLTAMLCHQMGEGSPLERGGKRGAITSMICAPGVRAFARWRHATNSLFDQDWRFWYLYINLA